MPYINTVHYILYIHYIYIHTHLTDIYIYIFIKGHCLLLFPDFFIFVYGTVSVFDSFVIWSESFLVSLGFLNVHSIFIFPR